MESFTYCTDKWLHIYILVAIITVIFTCFEHDWSGSDYLSIESLKYNNNYCVLYIINNSSILVFYSSTLIRKYYAQKEKLEQTENVLFLSKEECKQVCIDYKSTLEKNANLEKVINYNILFNNRLRNIAIKF